MPFIEVMLDEDRCTPETKQHLFQGIADIMKRVLHSRTEQVRVVLHEIPAENLFDGSAAVRESQKDQ